MTYNSRRRKKECVLAIIASIALFVLFLFILNVVGNEVLLFFFGAKSFPIVLNVITGLFCIFFAALIIAILIVFIFLCVVTLKDAYKGSQN